MSYQVLARKWRPKSFTEMAGQEHVLKALINALDGARLHHAYLFTGTRGVGKTTIGRILSKCLNCEEGVSSQPCGVCASCVEVDEGRFIDLIEVDAASRTGVDDMRDLLNNVQYAPTRGRYKIYLIDEVHMLSKQSFAALLKTLEEPPMHVKFLFATTDPQKLPITVLSRCLQFNLKNLSVERISQHLIHVLTSENISFEEAGVWSLGRAADGSMRDALSLTDQAIGHGGGTITEADVASMLGSLERHFVIEICQAMAVHGGPELLKTIARLAEQSPDYDTVLSDVLALWHQVAIMQMIPEGVDPSVSDFKAIAKLAAEVSREDVQLFYQICLLGRKDLSLAPEQRAGFEMTMLRAMAFRPCPSGRPSVSVTEIHPAETGLKKKPELESDASSLEFGDDRISGLKTVAKGGKSPSEHRAEEDSENMVLTGLEDVQATSSRSYGTGTDQRVYVTQSGEVEIKQPDAQSLDLSGVNETTEYNELAKVSLEDFKPENWIEVRRHLDVGGSLGEIASHCLYIGRSNDELAFVIDQSQDSLFDRSHQSQFADVLSNYFEHPVSVVIDQGVADTETPRAARIREKAECHAAAVESLNNDPEVIRLKAIFDAKLDENSVTPTFNEIH